jgi:hypothetical protein
MHYHALMILLFSLGFIPLTQVGRAPLGERAAWRVAAKQK